MISTTEFIKQSLALHLFFARIMKEHSFFLEISFTKKDQNFTNQADNLRKAFDALLADAIRLSDGVVSPTVLNSGEVFTQYTLRAEKVSSFFTGVPIATDLTQAEESLKGGGANVPNIEQTVIELNNNAIKLINMLLQLKTTILNNVLSCNMYTTNYPLLLQHIIEEAKMYLNMVQKLQKREEIDIVKDAYEEEYFWNDKMGEHAAFIRGLLDPTEKDLMKKANNFADEFEKLTEEAKKAMEKQLPLKRITMQSLEATNQIRDFKAAGTQGILSCKVKSIIMPLLGDHVLREANHYIRLLNLFNR